MASKIIFKRSDFRFRFIDSLIVLSTSSELQQSECNDCEIFIIDRLGAESFNWTLKGRHNGFRTFNQDSLEFLHHFYYLTRIILIVHVLQS